MTDPKPRRSSTRRARTRDARAATGTDYVRAHDPVPDLPPGAVRVRLQSADPANLDSHEAALRRVLDLSEESSDYPNRGNSGVRRYLTSAGVLPQPVDGTEARSDAPGYSPRAAAE